MKLRSAIATSVPVLLMASMAPACTAPEGDPIELGGGVDLQEHAIIDGSEIPDRNAFDYVVQLGDGCTGELIRNNVVLTARHCVTTNGTIFGPIRPVGEVEIKQKLESGTVPRWGEEIVAHDARDIALIRLGPEAPWGLPDKDNFIVGRGYEPVKYAWHLPIFAGTNEQLLGRWHVCIGYGVNSCGGGGAGTMRYAFMQPSELLTHHIKYRENSAGQSPYKGDSGSTCFDARKPRPVLHGIHSTGNCAAANHVAPVEFRQWVRQHLDSWAIGGSDFSNLPEAAYQVVDASEGSGSSSWDVSGGVLKQTSNFHADSSRCDPVGENGGSGDCPGTLFLFKESPAQDGHGSVVWSEPWISVKLRGSDNDGMGIVVRYVDSDNYYRVSVDAQRGFIRVVKKRDGVFTTLNEAPLSFTYSTGSWHDLTVAIADSEISSGRSETWFWVVFDGSTQLFAFDANENRITDGLVGLYTWAMQSGEFDDLSVRP